MVATGTETWIARHLGWPWIKHIVLPWISRASMKANGIEFSPNRNDMQGLDKLLLTAKRVDAIVVIGRTLLEHKLDCIRKFERVIFPSPESLSTLHYAKSVCEDHIFRITAAKATKRLTDAGIKVRWYPHVIHHSMLIVDAEHSAGWVQVECVLPFSIPNLRPRWRVYRDRQEQLVISMKEIFEKMWSESAEPSKTVLKQLTTGTVKGSLPQ